MILCQRKEFKLKFGQKVKGPFPQSQWFLRHEIYQRKRTPVSSHQVKVCANSATRSDSRQYHDERLYGDEH